MILPVLLLVGVIILCVFLEPYMGKSKWIVFVSIGICLILTASLKVVGGDSDSGSYENLFVNYEKPMVRKTLEPSFIVIADVINRLSGNIHWLFFIYAILAIPLKLHSIRQLSEYLFLPLIVYSCHYFILHDLTQIRAAVASGLLLTAIKPLCEGKRVKAAILIACAVVFHYSALALFIILPFGNKPLTRYWKMTLALVVPVCYLLFLMHFDPLTTLPIPYVGDKLELYKEMKDYGFFDDFYMYKNPLLWTKVITFYLLIAYHDTVIRHNAYLPVLLKIMAVSLACFFVFAQLPVLSARLSELFGIVDIITISLLFYIVKPAWVGRAVVVAVSVGMLVMDVYFFLYLN